LIDIKELLLYFKKMEIQKQIFDFVIGDSTLFIRVFRDQSGDPLFVAKDVCQVLEYTQTRKAINDHISPEYVFSIREMEGVLSDPCKIHPQTKLINERGVVQLCNKTRMVVPQEFLDVLENEFGITGEILYRYSKEMEGIVFLESVFQDLVDCHRQFRIGKYRVDLLMKPHDNDVSPIIIECDECDHRGYNKTKDELRTKILKQTKYTIVRYNPDGDYLKELSRVTRLIMRLIG
jgi:very-short-patch-repair endonuclease